MHAKKAAGILAAVSMLTLAGSAHGATFGVSGTSLVFEAAPGEVNQVNLSGGITDERSTVSPGPGCSGGPRTVSCPTAGITLLIVRLGDGSDEFDARSTSLPAEIGLRVEGGAGNDEISGTKRSDVLAGGVGNDILGGGAGGKDRVSGGAGNDRIYSHGTLEGGAGDDYFVLFMTPDRVRSRVFGGRGNDRVLSRNGLRDFIDCGPGRKDAVTVSDNDFGRKLDTFQGCEHPRSR